MRKALLILSIIISNLLFSQTDDFQVWSSLNLKYNINKKSNLSIEQSLRTFQNSSYWKKSFTEVCYEYRLNKNIKITAGYRYSFINKIEYISKKHRLFFDLILKNKFKSIKIKFRPRLQLELKSNEYNIPTYINRELLELSKNINDYISINGSTEFYFAIPSASITPNETGFYKYRLTGGVELKISMKSSVDIYYRYQHENNSIIENEYILGLSYKYNIN